MTRHFGRTSHGNAVDLYELSNKSGARAAIITYGGAVVSLSVPDRVGVLDDVVLGFDTLEEYENHRIFLGALIGRYANRIAEGRFSIGGRQFQLAVNNGPNHLHGGVQGFDRIVWNVAAVAASSLTLNYISPDGEEGYPGSVEVRVTYTLTDENELQIDYSATTTAETILALTNHSYFDLAGGAGESILDHELTIDADRFTPTDATLIPTGELRDVTGTPFDFRRPRRIGDHIDDIDEQIRFGHGYDHNWVLNKPANELATAARVSDPLSGRVMEVLTTEPGLQFYSGNYLDGVRGKSGRAYKLRSGFCLEAQHFPNSPNVPHFPSTVLKPGEKYRQTTIYRFSTDQ